MNLSSGYLEESEDTFVIYSIDIIFMLKLSSWDTIGINPFIYHLPQFKMSLRSIEISDEIVKD